MYDLPQHFSIVRPKQCGWFFYTLHFSRRSSRVFRNNERLHWAEKKARVCAPVRPALPDCGFCLWLLLFNLAAMLPLWRVFFYRFSAGINCANNVSSMEILPLCLFLWIPLWINSLFVDGNGVHWSKMWSFYSFSHHLVLTLETDCYQKSITLIFYANTPRYQLSNTYWWLNCFL